MNHLPVGKGNSIMNNWINKTILPLCKSNNLLNTTITILKAMCLHPVIEM